MSKSNEFSSRLASLRASAQVGQVKSETAYRNGQLLANSDDVSQWDNYDRYFKFYSIYVDENSYNRA